MQISNTHQASARLRLTRCPDFYRTFVRNFSTSGLTATHYCRKYHVALDTFRKYHKNANAPIATTSTTLTISPKLVRLLPDAVPLCSPSAVEILLPSGALIRLADLNTKSIDALRSILLHRITP